MKLQSVWLLAMVAAPALEAATILDVTSETSAQWQTGYSLTFEIFGGSFAGNAATLMLSRYPTEISFAFVTAPTTGAGMFSGALGSANGTVSTAFDGPLTFGDGSFSGAGYGAVSTLQGYLHLSALLSQELFSGGSVALRLRNDGPGITVGLEPYTLRQSLYFSLAGGSLSVGGIVGSVNLSSVKAAAGAVHDGGSADGPENLESPAAVPEPDSSALFLVGGAFCAVSLGLTRIIRRTNKPKSTRKINRLQSPRTL